MAIYSVRLREIVDEFDLTPVGNISDNDLDTILISTSEVNRPGLQLTGFTDHFGNGRVQIMGIAETAYLAHLNREERLERLDGLFKLSFPCIVVAHDVDVFPETIEIAEKYHIPVYKTASVTSAFMSGLIRYLNLMLAPRATMHGVLIEVYGVGVLILGESGVGKSETALEIVKRGHRLIADDLVEIRRV